MTKHVTDRSFETDVLKAALPVVVDFWASWCAPCQIMAPTVDELAREYSGNVEFLKLDIDENPTTPTRYGIRSIPTLVVFKNGLPLERVVGARPKREIKRRLDAALTQAGTKTRT